MSSANPANVTALHAFLMPIRHLMDDDTVMEICINRPEEVWVERLTEQSVSWRAYQISDFTLSYCQQLARLIATFADRNVSHEEPLLSATLPTGERVEVTMPPATAPGHVAITLRKHARARPSLEQMECARAFAAVEQMPAAVIPASAASPDRSPNEMVKAWNRGNAYEFLRAAVLHRKNILIAGKTQSGKTTLLRALIELVPVSERLVTIEDVAELELSQHTNRIQLFFSHRSDPAITPSTLLRASVRHRPDRILLGELRGEEALVFVEALNTGHPGSMTTVHANGAREAFRRVVDLAMQSPVGRVLGPHYVLQNLQETIDVVIFCEARRVTQIYYDPLRARSSVA
jgi:type IV secretion system protein VirB11